MIKLYLGQSRIASVLYPTIDILSHSSRSALDYPSTDDHLGTRHASFALLSSRGKSFHEELTKFMGHALKCSAMNAMNARLAGHRKVWQAYLAAHRVVLNLELKVRVTEDWRAAREGSERREMLTFRTKGCKML